MEGEPGADVPTTTLAKPMRRELPVAFSPRVLTQVIVKDAPLGTLSPATVADFVSSTPEDVE
jgi:hypothetical protein